MDAARDETCPFCEIVAGRAPATIVREWSECVAIVPLKPVVEGHVIVMPKLHVADFTTQPCVSAAVMLCASELAEAPSNIITSAGREATQSVFHLHLHIVPRADDDGLALPWYSGKRKASGGAVTVHMSPPSPTVVYVPVPDPRMRA